MGPSATIPARSRTSGGAARHSATTPTRSRMSGGAARTSATTVLNVAISISTKALTMFGLTSGACVIVGCDAVGTFSGGCLKPAVSWGIAVSHLASDVPFGDSPLAGFRFVVLTATVAQGSEGNQFYGWDFGCFIIAGCLNPAVSFAREKVAGGPDPPPHAGDAHDVICRMCFLPLFCSRSPSSPRMSGRVL